MEGKFKTSWKGENVNAPICKITVHYLAQLENGYSYIVDGNEQLIADDEVVGKLDIISESVIYNLFKITMFVGWMYCDRFIST